MRASTYFFFLLAVALAQTGHAVFVGPPSSSAGVIERQLEREYEGAERIPPEREIPLLEVDIPEETLDIPEGKSIYIESIQFCGSTVFSSSKLAQLAACYFGTEMSMREIHELTLAIQAKYVEKGYFLARAFPPEQTIKDGVLKIEILEGYLGEITVVGNCHYKQRFIIRYFTDFQCKPIQYDEFFKALKLLNENWDLNAALVFKKGLAYGTADIIIRIDDSRPVHLYADANNYGSRLTTPWRSGARLDYGNLLADGDRVSVAQVIGYPPSDLTFTDFIYNVPINHRGTRLEGSYLFSYFHVGVLRDLDLKGNSHVAELKLTHPIVRNRQCDLDIYGLFDYKNLYNFVLDTTTSADRVRVFGGGIYFDWVDKWRGRNIGNVCVYVGVPQLFGGSKAIDPKCSRVGAGGRFTHFNLDWKRIQPLWGDCFALLNFSGQLTPYKLPLAEQIYIGGFDTVRGYEVAAALGDNGYCVNLELRAPIPVVGDLCAPWSGKTWKEIVQFVAFIDQGGVFLNGGGEDQVHRVWLTGVGPGIRIFAPLHIDLSFDVGFPLRSQFKTNNPFYYFKVSIDFF